MSVAALSRRARVAACVGGLLLSPLGLGAVAAQTVAPRKVFGHYRQWAWTEQSGLPATGVGEVIRTRDGYVWLSTDLGLVRFDGVQFTRLDEAADATLGATVASAFLEDRAGTLWIASDAGLLAWRSDRVTRYGPAEGLPNAQTSALLEDREGQLWVGTLGGGLARLRDGRFTRFTTADGLPSDDILDIAQDSAGTIWVGTRFGLARLDGARFAAFSTDDGLPANNVHAVVPGDGGELWVGTDAGIVRLAGGRFTPYGVERGLSHAQVLTMVRGPDGALWVGSFGGGVCRLAGERFACHQARDGLPGDRVNAIAPDRDGGVWLATEGGLAHLRTPGLEVLGVEDGLAHDYVGALHEDRAGNLWVASVKGLNRIRDGRVSIYTTREGLPSDGTRSIWEDHRGQVWFGAVEGLFRFVDGRVRVFMPPHGSPAARVFTILEDRQHRLWLGGHGVLTEFRDGEFRSIRVPVEPVADVITLFEDRAGHLWLGTRGGGVLRYADGAFSRWTRRDGLSHDLVGPVYEDDAGTLWIATADALNRFKDGRFSRFSAEQGLPTGPVSAIVPDGAGALWLGTSTGLYRARLDDLNAVADGRLPRVPAAVYGAGDGLLSREFSGASPASWRSADGTLWLPSTRGLVHVRPDRMRHGPSRTVLEQARVDGVARAVSAPLTLEPGDKNLELRYTAFNWARAHAVRFRYRMLGLEDTWVEAGTRRTAYYPYLPPGEYTFQVAADDGSGVWPPEPVTLQITARPTFTQTRVFSASVVALVLGTLLVAWRWREHTLRARESVQVEFARRLIESQEGERQRIAAELHDSLGQRLVVINNLALLSLDPAAAAPVARDQLRQISQQASDALAEVTQISYNLRPYQLDRLGLTKAIEGVVQAASLASGLAISAVLDDVDGVLPKDSEIGVFRIVQESLTNLVKHAEATAASVTVSRHDGRLTLTVQDNGKGFNAAAPSSTHDRGGFGLIGLRERTRLLGGTLTIESTPGKGTRVHVELPLPM